MAPITAIKAVTPLTRAAKIQYSITDLSVISFLSSGDVPQIRIIAFFNSTRKSHFLARNDTISLAITFVSVHRNANTLHAVRQT